MPNVESHGGGHGHSHGTEAPSGGDEENMLTMGMMMTTKMMITSTMKKKWISVVWNDR